MAELCGCETLLLIVGVLGAPVGLLCWIRDRASAGHSARPPSFMIRQLRRLGLGPAVCFCQSWRWFRLPDSLVEPCADIDIPM